MPDAGQLELAQLLCKADSYLSLVLHRHLKPDTPDDLRRDIDACVGELRASYVTTNGKLTGLAASPSPVSAPFGEFELDIHADLEEWLSHAFGCDRKAECSCGLNVALETLETAIRKAMSV